ncbi:MAG: NAD(P)/FAD-dependent oxidoreductase [Phycisphaerales bacterium]|nr:NAD(P)/FAD-dependent oxidoreductase [Phycisphaerales bacterium]
MAATSTPRVVIIGGGFGGLQAAKSLARAPVSITLIDRCNHHLFQPLLYQVASAALSPAQIAAPIRQVLGRQANCSVLLAEAKQIDRAAQTITLDKGTLNYDYLIVAAGATHSYFGNDRWAPLAPGLKTLEDALDIRHRFLLRFEQAERETDPAVRDALMTFVVVGAGPTGVEMAGAMVEIALRTIPRDFRAIDTRRARVILVEAQPRVLAAGFSEELSARALASLRAMGVDVRLSTRVTEIDQRGVTLTTASGTERIASHQVVWAAGVKASPLAAMTGAQIDKAGRAMVAPDLSIPGHPNIFVIGDLASITDPVSGEPVPGVSPAAAQMGRFVARIIDAEAREQAGQPTAHQREPFRYRDKGLLATIGRARAVAHVFGRDFSGFLAWALWAGVHIFFLINFRSKVMVVLEWTWAYLFFKRGARLITGESDGSFEAPTTSPGRQPGDSA